MEYSRKRKAIMLSSTLSILSAIELIKKRKIEKTIRQYSVCPRNRHRDKDGYFVVTFLPMKRQEPIAFHTLTRMTVKQFDTVLSHIHSDLIKNSIREQISPEERLAFTIIYLAHGSSLTKLAIDWRWGKSTASIIVPEVCLAIIKHLSPIYLKPLSQISQNDWKEKADDYFKLWDMPFCCGAIDGKHVHIQAPNNTGSEYLNYKKSFSINVLACCDAKYRFTFIDIGSYGSTHDAAVYANSKLCAVIENKNKSLPDEALLPNTNTLFPYYFVADAAFPLKKHLQRPYPGKNLSIEKDIFNFRLSHARRTIENAFGIMVNRWRLLRQPIIGNLKNIELMIEAIMILHNFLIEEEGEKDTLCQYTNIPPQGVNVCPFSNTGRIGTNNRDSRSTSYRNILCEYFSTKGAVKYQYDKVQSCK